RCRRERRRGGRGRRRRSYAVDQVDRPEEAGEEGDRTEDREEVSGEAATAMEYDGAEEHASILRLLPSSPHELPCASYTDFVKLRSNEVNLWLTSGERIRPRSG